MHLKGRTAIVTGATRGIGHAIALKLAQEGANIVFNYWQSDGKADALKNEIETYGVSAMPFKVDVSNYFEVQEMKNVILEKYKTFDILINNAGIIRDAALAFMTREEWNSVIDVNLNGTFNMTHAVVSIFMKQKKGDIVNIASVSGIIGMSRQTNYASSKGAIIAFTKSLAKEVAAYNVRVNAVAPGFIETDMIKGLREDYKKKILESIPLGRWGNVEEVAETVNFLLNEKVSYITGQVIQVDGGIAI